MGRSRSFTALVLATLAFGQALAGPFRLHEHASFHAKKDIKNVAIEATLDTRDPSNDSVNVQVARDVNSLLSAVDSTTLLTTMGFAALGVNAVSDNGGVWIGYGGAYMNEFTNASGEDVILVIWGPWASWVNAHQPLVTVSLAPGASTTISFASGAVGAWSAIYADTIMVNGQISNTWGEYTMSPEGVVDVSREVNMNGHAMSIVGPQCTTNMADCVFVCSTGTTCITDYQLLNCGPGSQPGAQYGTFGGLPSGGCGGLGNSATLYTTLS